MARTADPGPTSDCTPCNKSGNNISLVACPPLPILYHAHHVIWLKQVDSASNHYCQAGIISYLLSSSIPWHTVVLLTQKQRHHRNKQSRECRGDHRSLPTFLVTRFNTPHTESSSAEAGYQRTTYM